MKEKVILAGLLLLGLLIRVIDLNQVPPALNSDELLKAFDGASVYRTGYDHHHHFLPLFFQQSGEYSPPLYIYFAGLFSAPLGINAYTVRLPSAILGTLTILLIFFLVQEIADHKIAWLAAILELVSPWNFQYSRIGWEAILQPPLQLLGLWMFFRWLQKSKKRTLRQIPGQPAGKSQGIAPTIPILISALSFGLTFYAYPAARVFIPLLGAGLFLIYFSDIKGNFKSALGGVLVFLLVIAPYIFYLINHYAEMQARWQFLSVFQPGYGWHRFILNYVLHLSPIFLFFKASQNPLHGIAGGVALTVMLPFFLLGFFSLFQKRRKIGALMIWWFLIFSLPSSLTIDRYDIFSMPNTLRSVCGIGLIEIVGAFGIHWVWERIKTKPLRLGYATGLVSVIALNALWIGYDYFVHYPAASASAWQYGLKEVVQYTEANQSQYDRIIISPKVRLHPVALASFAGRLPGPFRAADFSKYVIPFITYVRIYEDFGLQTFRQYPTIAQWYYQAPGKNLLVTVPNEITGETPLKIISSLDGTPAYLIYQTNR